MSKDFKFGRETCDNLHQICGEGYICDVPTGNCLKCLISCIKPMEIFTEEQCNKYCPETTTTATTTDISYEEPYSNMDKFNIVTIILAASALVLLLAISILILLYCWKTKHHTKMPGDITSTTNIYSECESGSKNGFFAVNNASTVDGDPEFGETKALLLDILHDEENQRYSRDPVLISVCHESMGVDQYPEKSQISIDMRTALGDSKDDSTNTTQQPNEYARVHGSRSIKEESSRNSESKQPLSNQEAPSPNESPPSNHSHPRTKHSENRSSSFSEHENNIDYSDEEKTSFLAKNEAETNSVSACKTVSVQTSGPTSEQQRIVMGVVNLKLTEDVSDAEPDETNLKQSQSSEENLTTPKTGSPVTSKRQTRDSLRLSNAQESRGSPEFQALQPTCTQSDCVSEVSELDPETLERLRNLHNNNPNRKTFDIIKKFSWVEGFSSEGQSIDVYVNFTRIQQAQALAELCHATGELPTKFNVRSNVLV